MNKTLTMALVGLAFPIFSAGAADKVSPAKAAELTCHRVERLVTLKKIPEEFLTHVSSVEIQPLPGTKPLEPAFRSLTSLVPGSDGRARQLELFLDSAGKALDYRLVDGPAPVRAPVWPDKDPVTLTENALHYVLDNITRLPELKPFHEAFVSIRLEPAQDASGQPVARAELRSRAVPGVLEVILRMDGTFVSARRIGW